MEKYVQVGLGAGGVCGLVEGGGRGLRITFVVSHCALEDAEGPLVHAKQIKDFPEAGTRRGFEEELNVAPVREGGAWRHRGVHQVTRHALHHVSRTARMQQESAGVRAHEHTVSSKQARREQQPFARPHTRSLHVRCAA